MFGRERASYMGEIPSREIRIPYHNRELTLVPCERITQEDLQIGLLGYKNLSPKRFTFAGKDKHPVILTIQTTGEKLKMKFRGKSAFLHLDGDTDEVAVQRLVSTQLGREKHHDDFLHIASVAEIEAAGWQVWWTPLPERNNWSHVRLVPNSVIDQGAFYPTEEEKIAITNVFTDLPNRRDGPK